MKLLCVRGHCKLVMLKKQIDPLEKQLREVEFPLIAYKESMGAQCIVGSFMQTNGYPTAATQIVAIHQGVQG